MDIKVLFKDDQSEVAGLFTSVFASSEGEEEGKLIGNLASELSSNIDNEQIICFGAYEMKHLLVLFSLLAFGLMSPSWFICSPQLQWALNIKVKALGRH